MSSTIFDINFLSEPLKLKKTKNIVVSAIWEENHEGILKSAVENKINENINKVLLGSDWICYISFLSSFLIHCNY